MILTARFSVFLLVSAAMVVSTPVVAQWQADGIPLSTASDDQKSPQTVPDGAGGAIVVWVDDRGSGPDLYAQRFSGEGTVLWTMDGVPVCTATDSQLMPRAIPDGSGGIVVTWQDRRSFFSYDIYAQRLDSDGNPLWTPDGVALCTQGSNQVSPALTSDGSGGAIVAWHDARSAINFDVYAQRVDGGGVVQWAADGVPIAVATDSQNDACIVTDGSGGAVIAWQDDRGATLVPDIWAQRVDGTGAVQWAVDGVPVCQSPQDQLAPVGIAHPSGGAIFTWYDYRSSVDADVYAQRIDGSGAAVWTPNGVLVSEASSDEILPRIVPDADGGALIAWSDYRGGDFDIYAQRLNATGARRWLANGVGICQAPADQTNPVMVPDASGGALVSWQDLRLGTSDIFAQRVDAFGSTLWTPGGVEVCTITFDQVLPDMVADGSNGILVAWADSRSGTSDVYAQRIELEEGFWGHPEPTITSVADVPGDQGGVVNVNWAASGWDARHYDTITHYSIWRSTDQFPSGAEVLESAAAVGPGFSGTAFLSRAVAGGDPYYWEWLGNQTVLYSPGYSFSAATRSDSTSQSPSLHTFLVVSHTDDPFVFWESNAVSGYSTDDLAPGVPLTLIAERQGADVHLQWNVVSAPDLRDYAIYRDDVSGVAPVPVHFLASSEDSVLVDQGAPTSELFYVVTARDVHENEGGPSNEAGVPASLGVDPSGPLSALRVLPNRPNPFVRSTQFVVGLPAPSDVTIRVHDVEGRVVRELGLSGAGEGWNRISFDGTDDAGRALPAGVYFYSVTAGGTVTGHRMTIAP